MPKIIFDFAKRGQLIKILTHQALRKNLPITPPANIVVTPPPTQTQARHNSPQAATRWFYPSVNYGVWLWQSQTAQRLKK